MLLMPPNDPSRPVPLDHPLPRRAHRVYVALTNHCNRACPWCSTYSSPGGNTWMTLDAFRASLPQDGREFQLQLEGGEPTIHPQFWEFVAIARSLPNCSHLVLCTNGVVIPRSPAKLREYVDRLGIPLTIKLSVNHHLLDRDPGLIALATTLRDLFAQSTQRLLVVNVRLRRGYEDDDRRVREAIESAGLLPHSNIFYLQRYGFASNESAWEPPAPVWDNFTLVNPDGARFGPDLIARSEAMGRLP